MLPSVPYKCSQPSFKTVSQCNNPYDKRTFLSELIQCQTRQYIPNNQSPCFNRQHPDVLHKNMGMLSTKTWGCFTTKNINLDAVTIYLQNMEK